MQTIARHQRSIVIKAASAVNDTTARQRRDPTGETAARTIIYHPTNVSSARLPGLSRSATPTAVGRAGAAGAGARRIAGDALGPVLGCRSTLGPTHLRRVQSRAAADSRRVVSL